MDYQCNQNWPQKVKSLIGLIVATLIQNDVQVQFYNQAYVKLDEDMKSNGYFEAEPLKLACAIGKPIQQWLPILIHQFNHFNQYLNNKEQFKRDSIFIETLFGWLNYDLELEQYQLNDAMLSVLFVQRDCQVRTVQMIKKYHLEQYINIEQYIQKSNAYIFFYHIVKKYKKWYKIGNQPYNNENIWRKMPKTFDNNYMQLDEATQKLYIDNL